jgi:uncharacterized protein YkwD
MHAKTLLGKRAATIAMGAIVCLGLTACLPAAGPATSGGPSDAYTSSLFQAINQDRAANGLPALGWNSTLAGSASGWAQQMASAETLYHQNLTALISSPAYAGFSTLGENILEAPSTYSASQMEAAWMASSPHRANILSGGFTVVGIAYSRGSDGRLWATQEFGG